MKCVFRAHSDCPPVTVGSFLYEEREKNMNNNTGQDEAMETEQQLLDRIIRMAEAKGLKSEFLEDVVDEVSLEIASGINMAGLPAQLFFLLQNTDFETVEEIINGH